MERILGWVGIVLWALMAAGPVQAMGRQPETPPKEPAPAARAENPLERIAAAHARGELDDDLATLYEVYAVLDAEKLPEAYRADGPIRDGTPVLRAARSRYDGLRPEIQEKIRPYLFPRRRP